MTYNGYFKCRLCKKEYNTCCTGTSNTALCSVLQAIDSPIKPKENIVQCPEKIAVHFCDDGSYGVADFIGFKKGDK